MLVTNLSLDLDTLNPATGRCALAVAGERDVGEERAKVLDVLREMQ